ncbi:MAG: ATP phosphoribosyltransferase [Ferroplasma sp.]
MKFVIPRGRLMEDSLRFLENAGISINIDDDRKLFFKNGDTELILPRARDVAVYTEYAGDIGICGSDTILESGCSLFVPLTLNFGRCRLSIIAPEKYTIADLSGMDIATKHPEITRRYLNSKKINANIIKLNGSLELAPETGLADAIVDIIQTGETIKKNNLVEIDKIMDISAVLIVNRISQKTRYEEINDFILRAGELNGNRRVCKKYIG